MIFRARIVKIELRGSDSYAFTLQGDAGSAVAVVKMAEIDQDVRVGDEVILDVKKDRTRAQR